MWTEYFNGRINPHTSYLDNVLGVEPIGVGDVILTEVLQGFRADKDYRKAKSLLMDLSVFEVLGVKRAVRAAENYRLLRRKGVTVRKTIDTLIATFCIDRGFPLLFTDRDFDPFVKFLNLQTPKLDL